MKHREWIGDKRKIENMLRNANLLDKEIKGDILTAMKYIIWYKYLEQMTVEEILAKLYFKHRN